MTNATDRTRQLDLIPFRFLIDWVPKRVRGHLAKVFWPTALPLLVTGVLVALLQQQWVRMLTGDSSGDGGVYVFSLFFLVLLLSMLLYMVAYLAMAIAATDAVAGRGVDMGRAWGQALRPSFLGTSVLSVVAVFLAFCLCILPGFFVAPLLALLIPIMVEERTFGWSAFRRCARLTLSNPTGRWADSGMMQAFVVLTVGSLMSYAASAVTQGPFVIVQQYLMTRQTISGQVADPMEVAANLWLQVPAQVFGALVTALVWTYWTFGLAMLYFEIRRRREAMDLEHAIDAMIDRSGTASGAAGTADTAGADAGG